MESTAFRKSKIITLFQFRQHCRSLGISDLTSILKGFLTHGKSSVVDQSAAAKCLIN